MEKTIKTDGSGEFVIMVEPFLLEKSNGELDRTDLGDQIATIFSERLEKTAESILINQDIDAKVLGSELMRWLDWHPKNREQLEKAAENRIDKYGTEIIVYGTYTVSEFGDLTINPQFYLSPTDFGDAWEILGGYAVGDPISIPSSATSKSQIRVNRDLQNRLEILSVILQGLVAYLQDDFEVANTNLLQAQQLTEGSELPIEIKHLFSN